MFDVPPGAGIFQAIAFVSAMGFVGIGMLFKRGYTLTVDDAVSQAIVSKRTPLLTALNVAVTIAGSAVGIASLLLVLRSRVRGKDKEIVDYLIYQTIVLSLVNEIARLPFGRQRPPHHLYKEPNTGFPSAHASAGVAFFGLLAVLTLSGKNSRKFWVAPLLLFVPAVGFSRVYLGVHWPSDVIAGYLLGASYLGGSLSVLADKLEAEHYAKGGGLAA
ncbi:MAG: phosphatase PAP2 family protein [Candidatus Aquicultorales bacterium]